MIDKNEMKKWANRNLFWQIFLVVAGGFAVGPQASPLVVVAVVAFLLDYVELRLYLRKK
jgi:hypothetical protein